MAMRLSGLMSGMDTESLISQLVEAKKSKVDKVKKSQIKQNWTQDAWKDLNTKLKNLQSKYISSMRFETAYSKKVTKVSDSSKASVITGEGAVNSVQSLEITQLAKTGYLTGAELKTGTGENAPRANYTALTKLSDMGIEAGASFKIGSAQIDVTADTTISDVLNKAKEAGLNASFDADNQRFFISAKESGLSNDFEILSNNTKGAEAIKKLGLTTESGATKVKGQDAKIKLNDAEFTNSSNVFKVNGLTITALSETKEGEKVTLTTEQDTDGIYDMVKNFLKEYNSVMNEMDKLYNATSAYGYDPLLNEEKDAMSESEVEEYEKKIKDSLLRGDSNLSTISMGLRGVMSEGISIGDKKWYLSDFGINTLGYFNAPENERNAYHIDGDTDDSSTSGNADKLKSLISSDPDKVISFFSQLSQNLYNKMSDLSKSVDGYRSFGNFYDDKKMTADYKDYTSKIADMEQKLNDYEDKWYSKFSKMEAAMAKMQSKTNALSGLIGGS